MKKIVLPGELVSIEQKRMGEHVFSQNDKIFADVLGIAHMDGPVAYVVPLRGRYTPKTDDLIVGIVAQTLHNGWLVNINAFYLAFVSNKEVRDNLQVGSILSAKIMDVSETKDVSIGFVRMFYGGEVLRVSPVKVPRMIGKNSSMLEVLKSGTASNLMIGRNGLAWIKGGDTALLRKAIRKIEEESHLDHLTEGITLFLKENAQKNEN